MKKNQLKNTLFLSFGALISSIGINLIAGQKIIFGGASGFSIIIQNQFEIPISITNLFLNVLLFLCSWKLIGRKFLIKSLYTVVLQSIFIHLTLCLQSIQLDLLVASVYGGILLGVGVGITIKSGGSTGGTDTLALIINHVFRKDISKCMFLIDSTVILLGIYLFGIYQALYALIVIFFVTKTVNYVCTNFEDWLIKLTPKSLN